MKFEWTKKERIRMAAIILISTLIIFGGVICPASLEMIDAGESMSTIRSVGGNSIAESYYQNHGEIYMCFGKIIFAISIFVCFYAGVLSAFIIKPVFKKGDVINSVKNLKERTSRAAEAFKGNDQVVKADDVPVSKEPEPNEEKEIRKCTNCGKELDDDSSFCSYCGQKL